MPLPRYWLSGVLLVAAGAGCKRDDARVTEQTADTVVTALTKTTEPVVGPNHKTLDLRAVGVWAKIEVPDNTTLTSDRRDDCLIQCGPTFAISVKRLDETPEAAKDRLTKENWTFTEQTDAGFVAETDSPARVVWRMFNPYPAGYVVSVVPSPELTAEQRARVAESVKTFRPVAVTVEEMTRSQHAAADLRQAGVAITARSGGLEVEFPWRAGTEKLLPRVTELVRVASLHIAGPATLNAAQLKQAAGCPGLRSLTLAEVSVADWAGLDGNATLQEVRVGNPARRPLATPAAAKALLTRLGRLPAVRAIYLRRYAVDPSVLQAANQLGKSRLTAVGFQEAGLTNQDVKVLAEFTGWKGISLSDNPIAGDGLSNLRDVKGLESLDVSGCKINDRSFTALSDLPLRRLDLSRTDLTDAGVKAVAANFRKLESLNLAATAATEACLPAVATFGDLRDLSLAHLALNAPTLDALAACKNLRSLSVADTPQHVADLSKLVGQLNALEFLDLRATALDAGGAEKVAKARPECQVALAGTPAADGQQSEMPLPDPTPGSVPVPAEKLPAADPVAMLKRFDGKAVRDEEKPDKPVVEVTIAAAELANEDLAHLRDLKSLEKLRLDGCVKITEAGLAYLKDAPALTHLSLARTAVTANGAGVIGQFKHLKSLELPAVAMTPKHLALMNGLADLESLHGLAAPDFQEALVDFLSQRRKLRQLNWGAVEWNSRRLRKLAPLTALETAEVRGPWVSDWGVETLAKFPNLRELTISDDLISDAGLKPLEKLAGLKKLHVEGRRFAEGVLLPFRNHEGLESLRLACPGFSDRGAVTLRSFSKLIELDLHANNVGDGTVQYVGELKDLEWIDLSDTNVTDAGLKAFKGMEELRRLTLSRTAVTGEGFTGAGTLTRLSRVELDHTRLTKKGLEAFAKATSIEELDVANTPVTDDAVAVLKTLPTLRKIRLDGNAAMTDKAADALVTFPQLAEVSVVGTKLTAKGLAILRKKDGLTVTTE